MPWLVGGGSKNSYRLFKVFSIYIVKGLLYVKVLTCGALAVYGCAISGDIGTGGNILAGDLYGVAYRFSFSHGDLLRPGKLVVYLIVTTRNIGGVCGHGINDHCGDLGATLVLYGDGKGYGITLNGGVVPRDVGGAVNGHTCGNGIGLDCVDLKRIYSFAATVTLVIFILVDVSYGNLLVAVVALAVTGRVNVAYTLTALFANAVAILVNVSDLDVSLTGIAFVITVAV